MLSSLSFSERSYLDTSFLLENDFSLLVEDRVKTEKSSEALSRALERLHHRHRGERVRDPDGVLRLGRIASVAGSPATSLEKGRVALSHLGTVDDDLQFRPCDSGDEDSRGTRTCGEFIQVVLEAHVLGIFSVCADKLLSPHQFSHVLLVALGGEFELSLELSVVLVDLCLEDVIFS